MRGLSWTRPLSSLGWQSSRLFSGDGRAGTDPSKEGSHSERELAGCRARLPGGSEEVEKWLFCFVFPPGVAPGAGAGARGADVRGSSDSSSAGRGLELQLGREPAALWRWVAGVRAVPQTWCGSQPETPGPGAAGVPCGGVGVGLRRIPESAFLYPNPGTQGRLGGVGRRPCEAVIGLGNKALFLPTRSEGARVTRGGALCEVGPPVELSFP